MKKIIYADNAATTQIDQNVLDIITNLNNNEFVNPSQLYSYAKNAKKLIKSAKSLIANSINSCENEIFFTSCGSESDNWALKGYVGFEKSTIITSKIEHHALLNTCKYLEQNNEVIYLNVDRNGLISLAALEDTLKKAKYKKKIVSIMMANNEIGTIEPIKELVQVAHQYNAIFHTDAVQCVGHIPIDVKDLDVDLLSASAHKFNGPKGIGFLFIKNGLEISPLIHGGSQQFGKRAGTENVSSIVGMAEALKNNYADLEIITNRLNYMEYLFYDSLDKSNIDYIKNSSSNHLPGLINISIKDMNGEAILHRLDMLGYLISTGSACDSVNNQISHVIKAIGVNKEYAEGTIRISFGKYNTFEDALIIAQAIINICK